MKQKVLGNVSPQLEIEGHNSSDRLSLVARNILQDFVAGHLPQRQPPSASAVQLDRNLDCALLGRLKQLQMIEFVT